MLLKGAEEGDVAVYVCVGKWEDEYGRRQAQGAMVAVG